MLTSTTLLSIKITTSIKKDIINHVQKYMQKKTADRALTIFTPNPEQIVDAQNNNFFKHILNESDINLPDGVGITWALKNLSPVTCYLSRISGIDFMEDLIQLAVENNYPVAFIGGRGGVAQVAFDQLKNKYPDLSGWTEEIGEIKLDQLVKLDKFNKTQQLALRIKNSGIKLVFVGLGAPKQEYFIEAISHLFSAVSYQSSDNSRQTTKNEAESRKLKAESLIFMSVGGAFDIFSGKLKRAPKFMQQLYLEWLGRLIQEPWRIGRQLKLVKFVWLVLTKKNI